MNALCQVKLNLTKGVWRRWFSHYIIFSCHFYLPHKNIWTLTSFIEGLLVENDAEVLERNIFINFVKVFSLFRNYFSLGKGIALHLNKFEFPSPMDALCKVWLKLVQWFLRRKFVNFSSLYFRYFLIISPWKGTWPCIWTNLNPLHPSLVSIGPGVLKKKIFKFRQCIFAIS